MGLVKEIMIEQMQDKRDEKIASLLGIYYDELYETDWQLETNESKYGIIFNYIVSFEDSSPKQVLNKVKNLNKDLKVWLSASDLDEDYYGYEEQYDAIISNKSFYDSFKNEISNVRQLNEIELDSFVLQSVLKRQLYITTIGALETFLSDTFINVTNEHPEFFRNFIESYANFQERKFQLNEIYSEYDKLKETAKKEMLEVVYHNLAKVKNMYISTFKIEFPNIVELSKAVNTRHDLVHRNGKTKNGDDVMILQETVTNLLNQALDFVDHISNSLNLKNGQ